ncbi:uncharacterized protein J7T54_001371 [Emericellopsis cladophorae]|uniref:Uncharacterized protein n=1 Tax=Emericellopsis cladophorae TaxID=2686198 RepID=A0A9P9Y2V9_9HYPO|nr:uncharacterized protein J7T54_001371 [Emericellopsis cladophorae]KAI6782514.1 hypothetical protein J7T54_001371 [Emericellopsis cladophorae]
MSKLIRQAAPGDLFAKALSRDRYKFIDQFDVAHVGEKYPELASEDLAWLRRRLGRAITQRRHYLSYIQDHRGRLEEGDRRDAKPESGTQQFKQQHQELQKDNTGLQLTSEPSTFFTKATSIQPGHITAEMLTVEDNADLEDDARSYTTISRGLDEELPFGPFDPSTWDFDFFLDPGYQFHPDEDWDSGSKESIAAVRETVQVNTVHDLDTWEMTVYIHGEEKYATSSPGDSFYDKYGACATNRGSGPIEVTWSDVSFRTR